MTPKSFKILAFSVLTLVLSSLSCLNSAQQPPEINSSPFAPDQAAVYRAFLADYQRGGARKEPMAVSELTEILQPDEGDYSGCMKGFPQDARGKMIHRLTEDFASANHLHIVNPKLHKIRDPQEAMKSGSSVESAVESAFGAGLLTLTEIIFDAKHDRAALRYSFYCGQLCWHAETVVYEKHHGVWKPSKLSCGFAIS